jgi:hypothetical protein
VTGPGHPAERPVFAQDDDPIGIIIIEENRGRDRRYKVYIVPEISRMDWEPLGRITPGGDILVRPVQLERLNINWRLDARVLAHGVFPVLAPSITMMTKKV